MKLNGWQRLWVVVVTMWLLTVLASSYALWPATADISKADVYTRMKADDGRWLIDYYDVVADFGGTSSPAFDISKLPDVTKDKSFMAATPADQKAYIAFLDPNFAKATAAEQDAYLAYLVKYDWFARHAPENEGPVANFAGQRVQFMAGTPQEQMDQTAREYARVRQHILIVKRAVLFGESFAAWVVPAVAIYLLGWATGWVRRGFGQHGLDRAGRF